MRQSNNISYGEHLYRPGPERHIRVDKSDDRTLQDIHEDIRQTLIAGFSNQNPDSIFSQIPKQFRIVDSNADVKIQFMNYGNTELVYLATIGDYAKFSFATLINQPHTPLGVVKNEFDNLRRLAEIDPKHVVKPIAHFAMEATQHELYVAPYIPRALCIAYSDGYGIINDIPYYRFEYFSSSMSREIKVHMIAMLVNYYDQERNAGLAKTEISGNDFLLTKYFQKDNPKTIANNLKLISAREFIEAPLDDYLALLKKEFSVGTYRQRDGTTNGGDMKVNTRSDEPMTIDDIEEGIELGLQMRQARAHTTKDNIAP